MGYRMMDTDYKSDFDNSTNEVGSEDTYEMDSITSRII